MDQPNSRPVTRKTKEAELAWRTGRQIAAQRVFRRMTQFELAKKAGLAELTICRIERGSDCALSTMRKIAAALELPVADLVDPIPPPRPAL